MATKNPFSLEGKTAIVTGGGTGIGKSIAIEFARAGADVAICSRKLEHLEPVEKEIRNLGRKAFSMALDVRQEEQVKAIVERVTQEWGRLDVMINNAGVLNPNARLHNLTLDDWRRVIDVNLLGVVNGITAAVRVMRSQGGGAIVSTASVAGMTAWAYSGPYGATKAAVIQLTRIAALEYAGDGIRVNCVCPGAFSSPMYAGLPAAAVEAVADRHPMGTGTTDDLVGAYVYLASDDARWTTGTALVVDGGYAAP